MLRRAVFKLGGCEFGGRVVRSTIIFFVQLELQRLYWIVYVLGSPFTFLS